MMLMKMLNRSRSSSSDYVSVNAVSKWSVRVDFLPGTFQ
jgi:hypothetical protein